MADPKPKSVVIGAGEIGRAIYNILSAYYPAFLYDITKEAYGVEGVDFLHICFPWDQEQFVPEFYRYKRLFSPKHVIVHSTVPVGTCDPLLATHSPVRGKHHDMERCLMTYTKFFGGADADAAANLFLRAGCHVAIFDTARATELAKVLETSFYGLLIRWAQEVDTLARKHGVTYTEVWDKFTSTYNDKAEAMGQPKFPIMTPIHERIGGHCVLPNLEFLPDEFSFKSLIRDGGQD